MKKTRAVLLVPAVVIALAGTAAGATKLRTNADPDGNLAFTKTKLSAKPGKVTIRMKNPKGSFADHGIAIGKKKGKVVSPGGTSKVTVKLTPGTYTFYCPVTGHRAAGMKGKLTVAK